MPQFAPTRSGDQDSRFRAIEDYLSRMGSNPVSAAVEGQAAGLNTPATLPSVGVENFADLGDVDDSGADVGEIPVFDGSNYVVTNWTPAAFGFGGQSSPTAWVHIGAGTAAANTSPLKLTSGTNLTSPEAGSFEYDGTELYFTRASTRLKVLLSTFVDPTNVVFGSGTGSILGATGDKVGFLGKAAIARPAQYTLAGSATRTFPTDPSGAYTGVDNLQVGAVYATVADLNTLRAVVSSLEGVLRQVVSDLGDVAGYGLLDV